jgi:hypothetical protein
MQALKLNYFTDPGHGWVSVKLDKLQALGIADQVSAYSYMRGGRAYLEEDCDLSLLYRACDAIGQTIELTTRHTNNRSPIRSYASYQARAFA